MRHCFISRVLLWKCMWGFCCIHQLINRDQDSSCLHNHVRAKVWLLKHLLGWNIEHVEAGRGDRQATNSFTSAPAQVNLCKNDSQSFQSPNSRWFHLLDPLLLAEGARIGDMSLPKALLRNETCVSQGLETRGANPEYNASPCHWPSPGFPMFPSHCTSSTGCLWLLVSNSASWRRCTQLPKE